MSNYGGEYNGQHAQGSPQLHQAHSQGPYPCDPGYRPAVPMAQNHTPLPYQSCQSQEYGENYSYYHDAVPSGSDGAASGPEGSDGEKGLGSTVASGAAGGYAAHKIGGGKLATAGGAVLGAVGMNMVSHKLKRNNSHQPAQTVLVVPVAAAPAFGATTVLTNDGLGGCLGLGSGLGVGGGLGLGRAHRRIARQRLGL